MKKVNRFIQGTIIVSSLFACDTNELDEVQKMQSIQEPQEREITAKNAAISITYDLTAEELEYLKFLSHLNEELLSNRIKAKSFSDSPETYLHERGYNYDIAMDDCILKLFQAYGDDEIYNALKANDIKIFFILCKERGYIDQENSSSKIFNRIKKDLSTQIKPAMIDGIAGTILFLINIGAGVYCVAVSYYYFVTYTQTQLNTSGPPEVSPPPTPASISIYPSVLLLDSLANKNQNSYILYDEYIENQINEIINILKAFYPEEFKEQENIEKTRIWLREYIKNLI